MFFASRTIGNRKEVGYHYGSLVYIMLTKQSEKKRTYGAIVIEYTPKTTRNWVNELLEKVMYMDELNV